MMFTVFYNNNNGDTYWWVINIDFKYIIIDEEVIQYFNFNVGRVEIFLPVIISEPGYHSLPNLLLCSSNFADEKYLSLLVCGSHNFIVDLMLVQPTNDTYCFLSSNVLGDEVMGYISHPRVLISWIMRFLPYHAK